MKADRVVTLATLAGLLVLGGASIAAGTPSAHAGTSAPTGSANGGLDDTSYGAMLPEYEEIFGTPIPQAQIDSLKNTSIRPPDGGTAISSAEAATARVRQDVVSIKRIDAITATRFTVGQLIGDEGVIPHLGLDYTPPGLTDSDIVWVVALRGEYRPSYDVSGKLSFSTMVELLDATSGATILVHATNDAIPEILR